MRELVYNGQLWARAVLRQLLQGRTARAFYRNSLGKAMKIAVITQYILTATQSFGSQDYCKKSRMTILELAGVLFFENEQAQTKWIIVCSEENTYLDAQRS